MLYFYMDDMLIAGHFKKDIANIKQKLFNQFDMNNLGDVSYILGMSIVQDKSKQVLYLSQKEYIGKVLQHFNMETRNPISTLPPYLKLS